jgi:hypothetical protein
MPDAEHFDDVALRHGDQLTRYMEDAVDAADDEAEGRSAVGPVFPVPLPREQVRVVPSASAGVQPSGRRKTIKLSLTDDELKDVRALAEKGGTTVSGWLRSLVIENAGLEWES